MKVKSITTYEINKKDGKVWGEGKRTYKISVALTPEELARLLQDEIDSFGDGRIPSQSFIVKITTARNTYFLTEKQIRKMPREYLI